MNVHCLFILLILLINYYYYSNAYYIIKNNKSNKLKVMMMIDKKKNNNNNNVRTILPILNILNNERNIILASGSPRRRELLNLIGLNKFQVITSKFDEKLNKSNFKNAQEYCLTTAKYKGLDVIEKDTDELKKLKKGLILISSDTIVEIDDKILEKPQNQEDAYTMLNMLRGRYHQVHTSVCIFSNLNSLNLPIREVDSFVSTSSIKFSMFSDEDLIYYISQTTEPYDKAGSYGIQGLGSMFVESINGDYFTIMGFPIYEFSKSLYNLYTKKLI